ncbi:MAG TPA: GAF and ANTAR domain-containing protein [Amycolatopsis sp.]|nr:GAF and ANTAR domain-containing protein [Amycolatopsis sp.]
MIRDEWGEDSVPAKLWVEVGKLAVARGLPVSVGFICDVLAERTGMLAGLILSGKAGTGELFYATGDLAARLAELEVTVGEGPVRESLELASSVFVADLDRQPSLNRWPAFAPLAVEAGVRACFTFPLAIGVVRAGVLVLYQAGEGAASADRLREMLGFADLLLAVLLSERAGLATLPLADDFPLVRSVVHQATGMIAAQLDIAMDDAFARMRARAFADDRRLADVAEDVVARKLQFGPEPG